MASRLSSLLVRDGLIGVKKMEQVFQRQVIYGGALDSILLEMKLVPEERLVQYLSLANGLPPATSEETKIFDPEAIKRCPQDMARVYGVAPLCIEGEALRVLVRDPVDLSRLEELADELELSVQPLVVPEYRFHVVFDRAYGRETEARFAALARSSVEASPAKPVGKARTVIVETPSDQPREVVDVAVAPGKSAKARTRTLEFSTEALSKHLGETEKARRKAEADRAAPAEVPSPRELAAVDDRPTLRDLPAVGAPVVDDRPTVRDMPAAEPPVDAVPREAVASAETPLPGPVATATPRPEPAAVEAAPMPIAEARAALEQAENRDEVFGILLRAVRSHAWYAGLLTIQGRAAIGRIGIAGDQIDRDSISQVLIPVDDAKAFATVVSSSSPYIGPVATGDAEIDGMIRRMGGVVPPAVLLLPVSIKNRVVAIAIGHRGADTLGIAEVSPLLPLAGAAADALSRIIVKAKSVGYRPAGDGAAAAATPLAVEELPTRRVERKSDGWATPAGTQRDDLDLGAAEVTIEAEDARPVSKLLDALESRDVDTSEAAMLEALSRADEVIAALATRFPGRLDVDRYDDPGRPLRAAEHGPLLNLVIQLGSITADLLIDKMRDSHRDVRFYATVCAAELRPRSALRTLVDRLFDNDFGVRGAAIEALRGYPARELEDGLVPVRQALHAEDARRVQAAANAVAELADVKAVPDLLDAVHRDDDGSPHARRALVILCKQDFGNSARKWRGWWDKNRGHHRIEWMIEGLGHKDEAIRRSSIEDLRRITGEYFGYHYDLPKKEREASRERWLQWWGEVGRRRFLRDDPDERHRPTAVLPVRRDPQ